MDIHGILKQLTEFKLAKPLEVLVKSAHLSGGGGRQRGKAWTAMSMQYAVFARGSDAIEAVAALLNNLVNHLAHCADNDDYAMAEPPMVLRRAFEYGSKIKHVDIERIKERLDIDVRSSRELANFWQNRMEIREARPEEESELETAGR
jgi:hypothetical protein